MRRYLRGTAAVLALLLAVSILTVWLTLRASLPQLDGDLTVGGMSAAATIERDADGVPTIRAADRRDLAFATGFAHGQDRFFQMDLMRRAAAGELAALLGPALVDTDKGFRVHGFRRLARRILENAPPEDRVLLDAYVAGVNAAMAQWDARPWEYLLLRVTPQPWQVEDSLLVAFSMYLNLNDSTGADELARSQLRSALPPDLYAFMHPLGTEWDAPVVGGTWRGVPVPGPGVFDLRAGPARSAALRNTPALRSAAELEEKAIIGSNSWAVAGSHTTDGGALLANDMHLGLRLPHIWYRARLIVDSDRERRDLIGVTLPGVPMLIVGSNGHVAWGFTNSYGDWTDLVVVEPDPAHPDRYLTANGSQPYDVRREAIEVRGADPITIDVQWTQWGPIVQHDAAGSSLALAWTAQRPEATNLRMLDLESATDVTQALLAANRAGGPVQNFVAADAQGRIGWSLMGQVPVRANYDSTQPASWRAPDTGWVGWRTPQEYPRLVEPAAGRLWTANARTIDAETWLAFMGDGGYDLGARAAQIRDDLLAVPKADAQQMNAIQIDDRALFLTRWRDLLLEVLDVQSLAGQPRRAQARDYVEHWSGRAAADDVGYAIVRAFRLQVRQDVFDALTVTARERFAQTKFEPSAQFESPLWQLVTERPAHLLDPRYPNWEAALLDSFDAALVVLEKDCGALAGCTWGRRNTLSMRHPLSQALPLAGRWLDMPAQPMPGDSNMPRAQGKSFGASERIVVSPGREAQGYFQMPGGQTGHPLSPFYGAGHEAWVRGEPQPLLPGATRHTLRLTQ